MCLEEYVTADSRVKSGAIILLFDVDRVPHIG